MRVDGLGLPAAKVPPRKPRGGGAFSVALDEPEDAAARADGRAEGAAGDAAPAAVSLTQMEALADSAYETASRAVAADRAARRHGRAMLRALAAIQIALLDDPRDPAVGGAQAQLAALAGGIPNADDPVLRLILREIGARAAVELARAGRSPNISVS